MHESIRAFIAINIDPKIVARLESVQRALKAKLPRRAVRWVNSEQMHLTLKFFRSIEIVRVHELCTALQRACEDAKPFELKAFGLGFFPSEKRPRVLWTGLNGDLGALRTLHERIEAETSRFGEAETRDWHPHLTIGRLLKPLHDFRTDGNEVEFGSWTIRAVDLIRSDLQPNGALHTRIASIEL